MKIARYWARAEFETKGPGGDPWPIACWRWSDESQDDAQRRADDAARDAAKRAASDSRGRDGGGYGHRYLDQPPREEILKEIPDGDGQTMATITRNGYGSLILNTRDLMFIDVDAPRDAPGARLMRTVMRWFGRQIDEPAVALRKRLAEAAAAHPEYTIRLYETFAGYRCAVVNRTIPPAAPESEQLLSRFDCDPLYVRLCKNQECYRARLTPKFWRCRAPRPPHRYPFLKQEHEAAYRAWEAAYEKRSAAFATCRFVDQFGDGPAAPQLDLLVQLHDQMTGVNTNTQPALSLA